MSELGDRLRKFRDERGYTREQAAAMANVSFSALEKWEAGRSAPKLDGAARLAKLYGTNISALVGETLMTKAENHEFERVAKKHEDTIYDLESMDEERAQDVKKQIKAAAHLFPKQGDKIVDRRETESHNRRISDPR